METKKELDNGYAGLPPDWQNNFWKFPRALDEYLHRLSGTELKVFVFILRQTIGYRGAGGAPKMSDAISLSQFQYGIGKKNKGTGLSKSSIIKATDGLAEKGFIRIIRKDYEINRYETVVQGIDKGGSNNGQDSAENAQSASAESGHTIDKTTNRILEIDKDIEAKIVSLFREYIFSGARVNDKGRLRIAERLQEFSFDQIEQAIINFSRNEWEMNNNSFRGLAWFFDSEDRINQYLNDRGNRLSD